MAQSPRRGIQAAARVGVYADVIDHVSALFLRDICIIGKIVSILFRNDPTRSSTCVVGGSLFRSKQDVAFTTYCKIIANGRMIYADALRRWWKSINFVSNI